MAKYKGLYTEELYRSLKPIPKKDVARILRKTKALTHEPRPIGSQKLSGQERYRLRQGDYRILYSIEGARLIVVVVKLGRRRQVYEH